MVTANVRQSARGISETLEDREIQGIAALAALGAAGLLVGQELSDFVLPQINMPVDPSTPGQFGAAALVKVVGAAVVVAIGARAGGMGAAAAGAVAFGMLALAGADFFQILQRGGLPGQSPSQLQAASTTSSGGSSRGGRSRRSSGGGILETSA